MRWILGLFLAMALGLAGMPAYAAVAINYQGDGATLTNDEDETEEVTCDHDYLRLVGTGTLSSGDSIFLEFEDAAGSFQALATYTSSDMPIDKIHNCAGRRRGKYKVTLDDADNSSEVLVEFWVVPRYSSRR